MENEITISKTFTIPGLIRFVRVPVLTRFFISLLCTLDDGLFISRYCGEYALAAFSLLMPYFVGACAIASLFAGVGSRCSILLGEKKKEEAQSIFTTIVIASFLFGCILMLLLMLFRDPFLKLLGASASLLPLARSYFVVAILYIPQIFAYFVFERFYTISGRPSISAWINVLQTISNFFFDWLFMVKLGVGLAGTAYSNFISNTLLFLISILFFLNKNNEFHFGKPLPHFLKPLLESFRFGLVDFLTSFALCLTSYIVNLVLLKFGAEQALAAYSIINTIQSMFISTFTALFSSTSPIASYAYGERNEMKLKRILKQSFYLYGGLLLFDISILLLFKKSLIDLYLTSSTNYDVRQMVSLGLSIVPFALPFFGINSMIEIMAVSINEHKISLLLSLIENVVLSNAIFLLLPKLFGIQIIWYSFLIKEVITFFFALFLLSKKKQKKQHINETPVCAK